MTHKYSRRWRDGERHRLRLIARVQALACALIDESLCSRDLIGWGRAEAAHSSADSAVSAAEVSREPMKLCEACPVREACFSWAEGDRYTGLAGGVAWTNGVAFLPSSTKHYPLRLVS